ncbi:MAG: hypothetical protein ACTSPB_17360, partial [Candidatus Thorarchaeota archaeon]
WGKRTNISILNNTQNQSQSQTPTDFLESAKSIVGESQYKTPDSGMSRGKKEDTALDSETEIETTGSKKNQSSKGVSKGTELRYESKVAKAMHLKPGKKKPHEFNYALHEALDGMATETDAQPSVLFKQFARALRVLGQRMGLGPLQDRLKEQGIAWKQSDDGQAIILTIKNATTKADQPIARISHETLSNPGDFEVQLKSMLDFATGDAPGAFAQKETEIADRKKAISDIAKAVQPRDEESEVAQQMNVGMNVGMTQETDAAATAAMPKPAAPAAAAPQQSRRQPQQSRRQPQQSRRQPQQQTLSTGKIPQRSM